MDAQGLLSALIAYSVEHYSRGITSDDLLIHAAMVTRDFESETDAEQWLSERMEDMRIAQAN